MTEPPKKIPPDWQVVENVVAAIERSLQTEPGSKIISKAHVPERVHPETTREVDVLVQVPNGTRLLSIGVDVKDEKTPLDVVKMEQLVAKGQKLALDRYCVLSTSGYTEGAETCARDAGIELLSLDKLHESEWWVARELTIMQRRLVIEGLQFYFQSNAPSGSDLGITEPIKSSEIHAMDREGRVGRLDDLVLDAVQGVEAERNQRIGEDGSSFSIKIDNPEGKMVKMIHGEKEVPFPTSIIAQVRFEHDKTNYPVRQFINPEGIEAFAASFELHGKPVQLTAVSVPTEHGRTIQMSMSEAVPPKTVMKGKMDILDKHVPGIQSLPPNASKDRERPN